MRYVALGVFLTGCTVQPLAPEGTDYVSVVSGSGFIGRSADWIYANDTLRREDQEPGELEPSVRWMTLPEGTYAAVRAILEDEVPNIGEPEFELCPTDMGADSIGYSVPVAGASSVSAGCINNGYFDLRSQVMAQLPSR